MRSQDSSLYLVDGPRLEGHSVKHNDHAYCVIIDNTLILCTNPTEYFILLQVLSHIGKVVLFEELMSPFEMERDKNALQKRISKLRRKLPQGLSIVSVVDTGYSLVEQKQVHQKGF